MYFLTTKHKNPIIINDFDCMFCAIQEKFEIEKRLPHMVGSLLIEGV